MKFCTNCGEPLEEGVTRCPSCGKEIRQVKHTESTPVVSKDAFDAFASNIADTTGKAFNKAQDAAKGAANYISNQVEKQKQAVHEEVQTEIKKAQVNATNKIPYSEGTKYMSSTELWSWLKNGAKRQVFYTEGGCQYSTEDFFNALVNKINDNKVPATIEIKSIKWDRSDVMKTDYFVKPLTNLINPLAYMVQFNHIGDFTFVEVKNFITPPDLPEVPMRPLPIDEDAQMKAKCLLFGVVGILFALVFSSISSSMGLVAFVVSAGLAFYGYLGVQRLKEIKEHNEKCAKQLAAWNEAWDKWEDSIFLHSFQEDINGQLSRIFDSVFECVKQVNQEIFNSKTVSSDEEKTSIYEMTEQIKNKREEYK